MSRFNEAVAFCLGVGGTAATVDAFDVEPVALVLLGFVPLIYVAVVSQIVGGEALAAAKDEREEGYR